MHKQILFIFFSPFIWGIVMPSFIILKKKKIILSGHYFFVVLEICAGAVPVPDRVRADRLDDVHQHVELCQTPCTPRIIFILVDFLEKFCGFSELIGHTHLTQN